VDLRFEPVEGQQIKATSQRLALRDVGGDRIGGFVSAQPGEFDPTRELRQHSAHG
jgi:hypothetical protein